MKRHRWQLLLLALSRSPSRWRRQAAAATTTKTRPAVPRLPPRPRRRAVSGTVSVMAVWTGPEQASFQAVIDGFEEANPDVTVNYTSAATSCRRSSRPRSRAATRPTSRCCRSRG